MKHSRSRTILIRPFALGVCFVLVLLFITYFQFATEIDYQHNNDDPGPIFSLCNHSNQQPLTNPSGFITTIREFTWDNLLSAYKNKKNDTEEFSFWCSKLLTLIKPALIAPPKVKVNTSCETPPTLQFPSNVPLCTRLKTPRKVAVLLQFGFDADILEIHFHELNDIVDKFFLLESTFTYYLGVPKPLIWEALKGQPRFEKFLHKVVHFVLDEQDVLNAQLDAVKVEKGKVQGNSYNIENLQEKMRWIKFMQWNSVANYFDGNDLLGFGDSDEIPNRNVVYYLKHCVMPSNPVDIGIWFPFGRIDQAFQTDWPVRGHPYSYGDPTYWTLDAAVAYGAYFHNNPPPSRQRGRSPGYLIGGMHMTHYGYFPFQLAKILTKIEGIGETVQNEIASKIQFVMNKLKVGDKNYSMSEVEQIDAFKNIEAELTKLPANFKKRIISLDSFKLKYPDEYTNLIKLPWFYDCNRERYPLWEGKHDGRLDKR
ncbi:unnamed protein product [Orchesella dallaii]|uniref:Beta-1,4-mannosyl-glycoprotein 4-beta-N-acetylglucosaminyltransferase n=1 Tax=Orchesella dallaii TaxID=48710 RepID=A0ABP1Q089_9HEXA